jgi:uncharacterized membrane protein
MNHNDCFGSESNAPKSAPVAVKKSNRDTDTIADYMCSDEKDSQGSFFISIIVGIISLIFFMGFGSCFVDSVATLSSKHLWAIVPTAVFAIIIFGCYKLFKCAIKKLAQYNK